MKTRKLIIAAALLTVSAALLNGCSTPGSGSHQENVMFPFDVNEWKIGDQAGSSSQRVAKFVRKGERIDNWTELVTMQTFKKQPDGFEPLETFYSKGSERMTRDCPSSVWNVISRGEGSILYEWKAQNCPGVVEQHEVGRFLDGKYNRFRIGYVKKVKTLPPEERDKWIKLLSEASIVAE